MEKYIIKNIKNDCYIGHLYFIDNSLVETHLVSSKNNASKYETPSEAQIIINKHLNNESYKVETYRDIDFHLKNVEDNYQSANTSFMKSLCILVLNLYRDKGGKND